MTKYIFVTGGVVSGIGKGITVASLGALLKARGFKIGLIKVDPYLNVDAGTMNPFQHGEVFVTDDGAETDLDLGHYERFTDENLTKLSNVTTGQIYRAVLDSERVGDYLGATIQIIPHITNEIKNRIKAVGKNKDIVICEIGGTVGDIESEPYIEAIRQMKRDLKRENVCYIHVTKIDYIYPSEEPKTKPTQQSVMLLRSRGIQPDILVIRSKNGFTPAMRDKISLFCDVDLDAVIPAPNAPSLYHIPLTMEENGLAAKALDILHIKSKKADMAKWQKICQPLKSDVIKVALVGKYTDNPDAYISVIESLKHAGLKYRRQVVVITVDSEKDNLVKKLEQINAIVVPGGFGIRGIEGKIEAVKIAREKYIPFLGLCLGLQCATIEYARNVCDLKNANSTEFNIKTPHPVIDILPEQRKVTEKGASMRLGAYDADLKPKSLVSRLYDNKLKISERHRHRYEVNPKYHQILKKNGLIFSGTSAGGRLVEFIELNQEIHPYFVATQAHPEFKSRPFRPSPLFDGLIRAAIK